ncbi:MULTISPECIES: transporter substrate-binding domain-containing protein [unclassified Moritella]|uniref:transporter substrate-binding domain-containing protein n=1 Tax=unclassified Moritella TaxID=2637987 RepID=UPI001BA48092|nr:MULTISPECIES: transporter substrate-binding domain-containing protein [unclassified Moritella]QUM85919.1 transporter substrate-binding domain-containing protein [Moritella sp. 28]QUM90149.1 transporter substrate-binding domain-containing protein [Moritella sp. 36]
MYKFLITKTAQKIYFVLATMLIIGTFIVSLQPNTVVSSNPTISIEPAIQSIVTNNSSIVATNDVIPDVDIVPIPPVAVSIQKVLRVLTWAGGEIIFPRRGHPQNIELEYLQRFADENNLKIEKIRVKKFVDLIPMLLGGKGDLIAANLTKTRGRAKLVNFTEPYLLTKEYLVMGSQSKSLNSAKDLNGREIVIQKGKSYESTALGLQKIYPKLKVRLVDSAISHEALYDKLASGEYDITIQDKNLIKSAIAYRDDIKMSLQASVTRQLGWGVDPNNKTLLKQLNQFLKEQNLIANVKRKSKHSNKTQWQKIQESRTVRFVLRNNLSSYYIWRGELLGFHYELAKRFAKEHKLRYEIIVAPNNVALLDYLLEDKADIALGFLTPTVQRRDKGIAFSRPYHYASELVVAHKDHPEISSTVELANSNIYIRPSSSYWESAVELKKTVKNINLIGVPESQETESIIEKVGDKEYEMTIADSHIVDIEMTFRDDIQSLMALGAPKSQSWAVTSGNNKLLEKSNAFIKKHYKGLFYNVIYNKYFKNQRRLDTHYKDYVRQNNSGVLSPYDDIVKEYASQYDFDWRLLVSQMHQESRFNPNAKSMAGAKGLFQLMPRTAKELGISNVHVPKQGIKAGVLYMNWVRERMRKDEVKDNQLIWFTLASYNAGAGHVRDAMRLAKQKGWRDDVWFGHVEKAMLLLSQSKYAAKARYGYVRGQEPVHYIREIKRRFETYDNILRKERFTSK